MPKRARCPYCDRLFSRDALDHHVQKCKFRVQRVRTKDDQKRAIIVDGNNVAYHMTSKGRPSAQNLILAYRSLTSAGYRPLFVVSSALPHKIDKPSVLNEFMLSAEVVRAPTGTNDDLRIIQLAKERNVSIVSNDRFLDWVQKYPWITARLKKYRMTPSGLILV
ncbi:MAG: hypothetical protein ACFFE2_01750 [Candidatus Thorarchaeota archaeon]